MYRPKLYFPGWNLPNHEMNYIGNVRPAELLQIIEEAISKGDHFSKEYPLADTDPDLESEERFKKIAAIMLARALVIVEICSHGPDQQQYIDKIKEKIPALIRAVFLNAAFCKSEAEANASRKELISIFNSQALYDTPRLRNLAEMYSPLTVLIKEFPQQWKDVTKDQASFISPEAFAKRTKADVESMNKKAFQGLAKWQCKNIDLSWLSVDQFNGIFTNFLLYQDDGTPYAYEDLKPQVKSVLNLFCPYQFHCMPDLTFNSLPIEVLRESAHNIPPGKIERIPLGIIDKDFIYRFGPNQMLGLTEAQIRDIPIDALENIPIFYVDTLNVGKPVHYTHPIYSLEEAPENSQKLIDKVWALKPSVLSALLLRPIHFNYQPPSPKEQKS